MRPKNEKAVCDFVRGILSAATGQPIEVTDQPDRQRRSSKEVEELWASPANRFAIEHTLLESFGGQLADDAKFVRLIAPIEGLLADRLPGTYSLAVDVGASTSSKLRYEDAHGRICDSVLSAAPLLPVGEIITLTVESVPFPIRLFRRSERGSKILVRRLVSDIEPSRLERVRRALADKCPKLSAASGDGRLSILALESNDSALANYNVVGLGVEQALAERDDSPALTVVVETDGGLFYGWIIRNDTGIPLEFSYGEGEF